MNAGTVFGDYRVLSVVGYGGMGVVYLAEDTNLGRRVALKVLAPQYTTDAGFRARFERESRLAAALDHPNVVPVYEAGAVNGVLFIAMRYVAGSDLRVVIDRDGPFEPARALGVTAQLASALDAAHDLGLIHRDVKPANVLLAAGFGADGGEHVYLSDFGLTKRSASKSGLTQLGQLVGTIDYIAPEQMGGGTVDGRADIYALGCVFFEMLAGRPPFLRETDLATMAAHLHEPPPSLTALRPDLPTQVDETVAQVLAKTPDQRFATAAAFVRHARASLAPGSQPPATAVRSDATVIVPPPIPPDTSPSSPTVLTDSSVPAQSEPGETQTAAIAAAAAAAAAAGAAVATGGASSTTSAPTVLHATPPSISASTPAVAPPIADPPPVYAAAPPPDSGPFYQGGGSVPPSYPPGGSSYPPPPPPPPPPPRSRTPIIAVAAAGAVGLVLVLLVSFAILPRAPGASPTLIAQVSSSPTPTLLTQAPSPLRTPSPRPSGSATPTATSTVTSPAPTPTATSTVTSPAPTPTATPTATVPPPTIPPATTTPTPAPTGDFARLLAYIDSAVGHCTEDVSDYDVLPVTEALCNEGTYIRRYALFNNKQDLNTAWNWFNIASSDVCNNGDQTWVYSDIGPDVTRGRLACFTKSDTTSATPQLMFTFADRNLLGVIVGNDQSTVADLYDFWAVDAGALVPPSQ